MREIEIELDLGEQGPDPDDLRSQRERDREQPDENARAPPGHITALRRPFGLPPLRTSLDVPGLVERALARLEPRDRVAESPLLEVLRLGVRLVVGFRAYCS